MDLDEQGGGDEWHILTYPNRKEKEKEKDKYLFGNLRSGLIPLWHWNNSSFQYRCLLTFRPQQVYQIVVGLPKLAS